MVSMYNVRINTTIMLISSETNVDNSLLNSNRNNMQQIHL